jgi:crotonobetaine/carnitine-CoA ligase
MGQLDLAQLDNPSLGNILEARAKQDGDDILLLFEDQRITCAQFDERANHAANGLLQLGVRKGDKVCLWLPNCPEWLYLWLGMAKIGAVLVPVLPVMSGSHLTHLINHSDAETVIAHSSFIDAFNAVADSLENVKNVVVDARESPGGALELPFSTIAMEQLFDSLADPPGIEVGYPDVSHIVYTSGTTGFPKGLLRRHPAPGVRPHGPPFQEYGLDPGEVVYTCYALHTSFSDFIGCIVGGLIAAVSREKRIDSFWDDIRRYDAVAFNYFADLIPALLKQPEKENDRDNPARWCSGIVAPRDPETISTFENRFGVKIIETFGAAETGDVTINWEGKPGSIGKPLPQWEVKIVDDEGNEVGPNVVGEIVHRHRSGEPVVVEYYKMPEKSADKTRDGWYHSDDLGYKDEEGYLYFADRKLDVIKREGKKIIASAIEAVVCQHDSVVECAAVGVPCDLENDEIKLCVIREEGKSVAPEDLYAYCVENLEEDSLPRYIQFRDGLPKNARGKVQRYKLRGEGVTEDTWDTRASGHED